jgi:hypothetical protein
LEQTAPDSANKIIAERYRVIDQLGSGGVGVVYRAIDLRMSKKVAVKILSSPTLSDDVVMRFQREARSASQLLHRNLISIYDFGITGDREPYMVMELIIGKTLHELLEECQRLSVKDTIPLLTQVCSAMAHAHKNGVVHRDLKTSNIMLEDTPDKSLLVKILDFGIAKLKNDEMQELTRAGQIVGTANYMSPEQASEKPVDHRSDIYSLGCVMYKMLTGVLPFEGESYMETLSMHRNEPIPSLHEGFPNTVFSRKLEEINRRALAKHPDDRFQTMDEFSASLNAAASSPDVDDSSAISTASSGSSADALGLAINTSRGATGREGTANAQRSNIKVLTVIASIVCFVLVALGAVGFYQFKANDETEKNKAEEFLKQEYGHTWIVIPPGCRGEALAPLKRIKNVNRLRCANPKFSDADMPYISGLPLQVLNLSETSITDNALKSVHRMPKLKCLMLKNDKAITDRGVAHLEHHSRLTVLSLQGTSVSDDCAKSIESILQLRALDLSNCPAVGDRTIDVLSSMTALKMLSIGGTGITGDALKRLNRLQQLRFLSLNNLNLVDSDIENISTRKLQALLVNNNPRLTDAALVHLVQFPILSYVAIDGCKNITLPGVLNLMAERNCNSDNSFFKYIQSPSNTERDHWGFFYDPIYYDLGFKRFMAKYGLYYGCGFLPDSQNGWLAQVNKYVKDPAVTSKLRPVTLKKLQKISEVWSEHSQYAEVQRMYQQADE